MWEGVEDGTIDFFATDHAPHTKEEKLSDQIFYGIPGVETFFPLLYTEFVKREYDLTKLSAMTSFNTFQTFKVKNSKGLVKPGYEADCFLFDPRPSKAITAAQLNSKCEWTPFENYPLKGELVTTWVGGTISYNQKSFTQRAQVLPLEF
jgi:dihydroorotase